MRNYSVEGSEIRRSARVHLDWKLKFRRSDMASPQHVNTEAESAPVKEMAAIVIDVAKADEVKKLANAAFQGFIEDTLFFFLLHFHSLLIWKILFTFFSI